MKRWIVILLLSCVLVSCSHQNEIKPSENNSDIYSADLETIIPSEELQQIEDIKDNQEMNNNGDIDIKADEVMEKDDTQKEADKHKNIFEYLNGDFQTYEYDSVEYSDKIKYPYFHHVKNDN